MSQVPNPSPSAPPITVEQPGGAGGPPNIFSNPVNSIGLVDQIAYVPFGNPATAGVQVAAIVPGNPTFGTTPVDQAHHAPNGDPAGVGIQSAPVTPVYPNFGTIAEDPIHRATFGETIATDIVDPAALHHDWLFG